MKASWCGVLVASLVVVLTRPAQGADWPQWRGPARQGWSPAKGIPDSFPKEGLKLLWKSEKITRGDVTTHSQNGSPLVAIDHGMAALQ